MQGSQRVNPFCVLMTQTNKTCAACLQLQQRVEEQATMTPKTLQCYAGLSETAVPVRFGNTVLGYLQTGQVFIEEPSQQHFQDFVRVIQAGGAAVDTHEMESAYFRTRVVTAKQYESIIRLLAIFSEHLETVSNQILISEATSEAPAITKARSFMAAHHGEKLSLNDVARAAHMSVFYFSKFFKKETGINFGEYLTRLRIESVKKNLLNFHTHITDAAYAAGFQSLSQFNRMFRRIMGETPGDYRARFHG